MTPMARRVATGPGRLDLAGLGVIRRIRPVNLEYMQVPRRHVSLPALS